MSIDLSITNQTGAVASSRWLMLQLRGVLKLLEIPGGSWTVTIVNDRAMAALHRRTMGIGGTTDVLTFDLRDGPAAGPRRRRRALEGTAVDLDTVVCRDVAARRARELGHPVKHELLLYALHSLLHVQGYDDVSQSEAQRMHRREDEVLIGLGLGPVFQGAAGHGVRRRRMRGKRET